MIEAADRFVSLDGAVVPVLIAGGGASGTMQALLLAKRGLASIVAHARR